MVYSYKDNWLNYLNIYQVSIEIWCSLLCVGIIFLYMSGITWILLWRFPDWRSNDILKIWKKKFWKKWPRFQSMIKACNELKHHFEVSGYFVRNISGQKCVSYNMNHTVWLILCDSYNMTHIIYMILPDGNSSMTHCHIPPWSWIHFLKK